jgi:4-hydroxybenzoate-CoA ligase
MALNGHATGPGLGLEATGNAVDFFLDRHVREGRGGRTAFIDESGSITYKALCEATAGFASGLLREAVHRETRIALILLDTMAFPIAFWGALRAGVVPVLVNTLLPASQIRYILEDCRAEAAIVSAALLPTLAAALAEIPDLRLVVVAGDAVSSDDFVDPEILDTRCLGFAAFIAGGRDIPPVAASAEELAFLLYTSGSTGKPKGVRHVHGSLRCTAEAFGAHVLGITAADLVFSVAKLFFAYGFGNAMTFPMAVGAAAVLSPARATPEHVLAVIAQHRPSIFYGVPTLYAKLLNQPGLGRGAGSDRLRCCISAGEALPAHIGRRWAVITGVDILDAVGSTEMLHAYLSNRPGAVRYGSCGRAVPGYDVRLVDEDGVDVEGAGAGELLVRGESMADGYWNQRKKTRRTFLGEWTVTGDCYTRDADGIYTFCGRTDDMFKVCGIWVSPVEVEASLISHEAVLGAAVVADQDDHDLTKPRAFVVVKPGTVTSVQLIAELQEHVKQQIGPWKFPRWIEFVPDLPETVTGKIQRFKLRGLSSTGAFPGHGIPS